MHPRHAAWLRSVRSSPWSSYSGQPGLGDAFFRRLFQSKFVATVIAADRVPTVLNATDSDWVQHEDALARHEVRVEHLCPNELKEG